LKKFIPVIIWAVIILFLSLSSGVKIPESMSDLTGTDKIGHLVIYAIFSFLAFLGVYNGRKEMPDNFNALLVVGLCSIYGVLMEILQFTFFPGRYFEFLDIIANIIGSFTGLFAFKFFINKKS
jgi:VanZ family protein